MRSPWYPKDYLNYTHETHLGSEESGEEGQLDGRVRRGKANQAHLPSLLRVYDLLLRFLRLGTRSESDRWLSRGLREVDIIIAVAELVDFEKGRQGRGRESSPEKVSSSSSVGISKSSREEARTVNSYPDTPCNWSMTQLPRLDLSSMRPLSRSRRTRPLLGQHSIPDHHERDPLYVGSYVGSIAPSLEILSPVGS